MEFDDEYLTIARVGAYDTMWVRLLTTTYLPSFAFSTPQPPGRQMPSWSEASRRWQHLALPALTHMYQVGGLKWWEEEVTVVT
jgi:hypothetical protein